jgi:hypothetical protein
VTGTTKTAHKTMHVSFVHTLKRKEKKKYFFDEEDHISIPATTIGRRHYDWFHILK